MRDDSHLPQALRGLRLPLRLQLGVEEEILVSKQDSHRENGRTDCALIHKASQRLSSGWGSGSSPPGWNGWQRRIRLAMKLRALGAL